MLYSHWAILKKLKAGKKREVANELDIVLTITSIKIEKNITKGKPDGKGKEAKTDVDTILYIEKHPISD